MTSWLNDQIQGGGNSRMIEQQISNDPCQKVMDGAGPIFGDSLHWMMCLDHQLGRDDLAAQLRVC